MSPKKSLKMWSKELNCDAKKSDDKHFFYFKLNFSFTIKFKKSLTLRRSTENTQMNISICLRISTRSVHTIGRFARWRSRQKFKDILVQNYKATPARTAILDVTMKETLVVLQNKIIETLWHTYNFSSNKITILDLIHFPVVLKVFIPKHL